MKRFHSEPVVTKCIPMRFKIDQESASASSQFFLCHSPALFPDGVVLHDQHDKLRNEFNLLDVPFAFPDINWEQLEDRVKMYKRDDSSWYDMNVFVRMEASEKHMDLIVTLLEPGKTLKYDNFGNIKTNIQYKIIAEVEREISDAARTSHIPDDMRPVATQTAAPGLSSRASAPKRPPSQKTSTADGSLSGSQSKDTGSAADIMRKHQGAAMLRACDSDCDNDKLLPLPPPPLTEEKHVGDDGIHRLSETPRTR